MRNLDSCRCWRCTSCPCKVRNKFLVNFWNCTIHLYTPCIVRLNLYTYEYLWATKIDLFATCGTHACNWSNPDLQSLHFCNSDFWPHYEHGWQRSVFLVPSILQFGAERVIARPRRKIYLFLLAALLDDLKLNLKKKGFFSWSQSIREHNIFHLKQNVQWIF